MMENKPRRGAPKKSPDILLDKSFRVLLSSKELRYLNELVEFEGDTNKSTLLRRMIHERYKEKIKAI